MKYKDKYQDELRSMLCEYAEIEKPQSYLEIGVNDGGTISALLRHHMPKRVVLCDTWGNTYGGLGRGNHDHIVGIVSQVESVTFLDGSSHDLLKTLKEKFDFITIDGDHSEDGAYQDLDDCWMLLNDGGRIFFDDVFHRCHQYLLSVVSVFETSNKDCKIERIEHFGGLCNGACVLLKQS